jgi:branched-chain amino acid transport system permease protein
LESEKQYLESDGQRQILPIEVCTIARDRSNFLGAFSAGLIIGVAETVGGFFLSPILKQAVSFTIFIIVLLFLPKGLFGKELKRAREK